MLKVGFVGWRGLVGSVLLERMRECGDFEGIEAAFFSTSDVGGVAPVTPRANPTTSPATRPTLEDAFDVDALARYDVIITCQGTDYTRKVHPKLREEGWSGYWIDAASALRMEPETVLLLDPINAAVIQQGLAAKRLDYCGANCTVSLMLMALGGLFSAGVVEWLTAMTYQAASGAGAKHMTELAAQMRHIGEVASASLDAPAVNALDLDRAVAGALTSEGLPTTHFGAALAGSLIPWVDGLMDNGQSREEWKGFAEGNKILGSATPIPIDGICVRIAAMRCHAQAFTIKLTRDIPVVEVEAMIAHAHPWVHIVENTPEATIAQLTPAIVTGSLNVPVGRVRKLEMGGEYLTAFSVGDQLLWGAAEPLRRMLRILRTHLGLDVPDERAVA